MTAHASGEKSTVRAGSGDTLTADDVFEVLGNRRRRYVFHHLKHHAEREVSLDELTDRVAAWECDGAASDIGQRKRNSVRTALRQSHLPMMAERGLVDYDRDRKAASLAAAAAGVDVYLDVVGRGDVPWSHYYLGLAVSFGLLFVMSATIRPWGVSISAVTVAAALAVTLSISALIHTYYGYTEMRLGVGDTPPELRQR